LGVVEPLHKTRSSQLWLLATIPQIKGCTLLTFDTYRYPVPQIRVSPCVVSVCSMAFLADGGKLSEERACFMLSLE
jgi:hypothetical protein